MTAGVLLVLQQFFLPSVFGASPVLLQISGWDLEQCFLSGAKARSSPNASLQSSEAHASFLAVRTTSSWNPMSVDDLSKKYDEVFGPHGGNRNAASHLWAKYIIDRTFELSHRQIDMLFSGFCAVSGSPIGPDAQSRYKISLPLVGGGEKTGYSYHCCWPCVCDETALIKVDTKTIKDMTGEAKQYHFEVIGDPCVDSPPKCTEEAQSGCIPYEAPAIECTEKRLENAIRSDGGHIIIGMYFTGSYSEGQYIDYETMADQKGNTLKGACEARTKSGYNSGMGAIFQQVARLNQDCSTAESSSKVAADQI